MRVRRRRDQRGAAAVEFALVLPLLLTLVFGIIETAFLLRDDVAVTSAVRTGARIASAAPGAGEATCDPGIVCAPKTTPKFAQMAADAIQVSGSAMPMDQIEEIWVYKANDSGLPGTATNAASASCSTKCVRFRWQPARNAFRYADGTWDEASVNSCPTTADRIGVRMITDHDSIIGFFGSMFDVRIADEAVMTFEPETLDRCRNTV